MTLIRTSSFQKIAERRHYKEEIPGLPKEAHLLCSVFSYIRKKGHDKMKMNSLVLKKGKKQSLVLLDIFGTIILSLKVKFINWR